MNTAAPRTVGNSTPAAAETQRLYASDWGHFARWCSSVSAPALPAGPATLTCYLEQHLRVLSIAALRRRLAAIRAQHRQAGLEPPALSLAARATLSQVRPRMRNRSIALPAAQLRRLAAACPPDLAGLRDRAVLLLLSEGLKRSAIVGLDAEAVRFEAAGLVLALPARAGVAARALTLVRQSVTRGSAQATMRACPVRALEAWMQASDAQYGPLFRKIDRWGNLEHQRLGTDALRRILARRKLGRLCARKAAA